MLWKQRFSQHCWKPQSKMVKRLKTLLDALLLHQEKLLYKLGFMKKINHMEAKGNTLADHFAKQAVLTKVMFLSKHLKDKSMKEFKETIMKYQYLAPYSEKKKEKKYDSSFTQIISGAFKIAAG